MGGTSVATGRGVGYYQNHAKEGLAAAADRGYYSKAVQSGEPPAELLGRGLEGLGLELGLQVTDDIAQQTWDQLRHPETGEKLGQAIATYSGPGERLARAASRAGVQLPEVMRAGGRLDVSAVEAAIGNQVTPEEMVAIKRAADRGVRETVTYYDTLFTQDKSISVAHAAADAAGDSRAGDVCEEALRKASEAVVRFVDDTIYVRAGNHGKSVEGRSSGRYEKALGVSVAAYRHHTSRAGDMHDHVHLLVLNRAQSEEGGKFRALDGTMLYNSMGATTALGSRAAEMHISAELGWRWAKRADGTRYLPAVDAVLVQRFSKRAAGIEERLSQWSEAFEAEFGRAPSARERDRQHRDIQRRTRAAKPEQIDARDVAVAKWDAEVSKAMTKAHVALTLEATKWARKLAAGDVADEVIDQSAVVDQALASLRANRTTFTRWHLMAEVDKALPANMPVGMTTDQFESLIHGLVEQGVRRMGVEELTPVGIVDRDVPIEMQDPKRPGVSVFSPPAAQRYADTQALADEAYLLRLVDDKTAPAIEGERAILAADRSGLSGDQARAFVSVLSSQRRIDVLVGPAGTGKSYTVAKLAEAWQHEGLGTVIGLAKSNAAAAVLAGEGIESTWNVDRWLSAQERMAAGRGRALDGRMKLGRGSLVVIDEASMVETETLVRVAAAVEANGGKVLLTGDHRQLDAVGASGFFELAAEDSELRSSGAVVELHTVRRFEAEWEGTASLALRSGDAGALEQYDRHGRIVGLSDEDPLDVAAEQWVTDRLEGREAVVVVDTSEQAAAVSMKVRRQLIDVGQVNDGLAVELANGAQASVGDLIQARENDYGIKDSAGVAVSNRDRLMVTNVYTNGNIKARRVGDKATVVFDAEYVAKNIDLAYARTAHGAQGLTVDRSYTVVGDHSDQASVYVGMTRGRQANFALVGLTAGDDEHGLSPDARNPLELVSEALQRRSSERSATGERRAQVDASKSLARLGPAWSAAVARHSEQTNRARVAAVLGAERMGRLDQSSGVAAFWHQFNAVEGNGIDAVDTLRSTMAAREVDSADDLAPLLAWRLASNYYRAWEPAQLGSQRLPAAERSDLTYLDRSPEPESLSSNSLAPDTMGAYARQLAAAMDERVNELGRRTASEAPEWATQHLGAVPTAGTSAREAWEAKAGLAAAYREQYLTSNQADRDDPIGRRPDALRAPERLADWQRANNALGIDRGPSRAFTAASDAELLAAVRDWERTAATAPSYVGHELDGARRQARQTHAQLVRLETSAGQFPGQRMQERLVELRVSASEASQYLESVEQMHGDRRGWYEVTEVTRTSAREAAAEMMRRYPDRNIHEVEREPEELSALELRRYDRQLTEQRSPAIDMGITF